MLPVRPRRQRQGSDNWAARPWQALSGGWEKDRRPRAVAAVEADVVEAAYGDAVALHRLRKESR